MSDASRATSGFCNNCDASGAALPVDVRKASSVPLVHLIYLGLQIVGHSPEMISEAFRKGSAFPHIRRQSGKRVRYREQNLSLETPRPTSHIIPPP